MKARIMVLGLLLTLAAPSPAAAKSKKVFTYRYDAIWSTAVRLLRADKGYTIRDKDKETGYVLFVYPGRGSVKACKASLEIFRTVDQDGFSRIRVQLKIAHQPSYVEAALLDALEQKLQEEQGTAPQARKAPGDARGKKKDKKDKKGKKKDK